MKKSEITYSCMAGLLFFFSTALKAQPLAIPFAEYFSGYSMPTAWTQQTTGPDTLWNISYSNYAGGDYFEAGLSYQYSSGILRLLLPPLATSGLSEITLEFRHLMMDNLTGALFNVQSSNDGINWNDESWTIASGGGDVGPEQVSVNITNNLGGTTYLAFTVSGDHSAFIGWFIDNVEVYLPGPPSCPAAITPPDGSVIQALSVMLDWQSLPNADGCVLYVGTDDPPSNIINGMDVDTNTMYLLENLDYGTTYHWLVIPYNNNGSPVSCPVYIFTTYIIYDLPFTENFDGASVPPGWQQQSYSGMDYWSLSFTNTAGGTANEMLCGPGSGYDYTRLVLPPVNTQGLSYLNLSFRTRISNCDWDEYFSIQTSTDGINWTYENWSYTGGPDLGPVKINAILSNNLGGTVYVAFYLEGSDFSYDYWSIDEVSLDALSGVPDCSVLLTPPDGATALATYPFIRLEWDAAFGATGYLLNIGTDNPPTNYIYGMDMGFLTSFDLPGLSAQTTYYWQVVPYNMFGNASDCPVFGFSTAPVLSLPFIRTFDTPASLDEWTIMQPEGFAVVTHANTALAGGSPGEISITPGSGTGTLMMISPPLHSENIYSLGLKFRHVFEDAMPGAIVKIQTSPDGLYWTDENWVLASGGGNAGPGEVYIPIINLYWPYMYFAFVVEGDASGFSHWYLDDVRFFVDVVPSCVSQLSPAGNAIALPVDITFSWEEGSGADGYRFFLGTDNPPTNVINGQDVGDTTSFFYAGLDSATTYFWSVIPYNLAGMPADCPVSAFTTVVPPVIYTLPFAEDFTESQLPADWDTTKTGGIPYDVWHIFDGSKSGGTPPEASASFSLGIGTARLITPFLNTAGQSYLALSFRTFFEVLDSGMTVKVQSSNDGINWSDEAWLVHSGNGDFGPETVTLLTSSVAGSKKQFAFTVEGDLEKYLGWYVDNVEVVSTIMPPACSSPVFPLNAASGVLTDTELQWAAVTGAAGYYLYFGTDDPPTNILAGTNLGNVTHYQLQDLDLGTTYYWKIVPYNPYGQADSCVSWSFATYSPFALPYSQYFSDPAWPVGWSTETENAYINWSIQPTSNAGGTQNEIKGWASSGVGVSRLICPAIQTSGAQSLNLRFKYFYNGYYPGITFKIQSSPDGVTWTDEIWQRKSTDPVEASIQVNTTISNNLGSLTWIAFVAEGNHANFVWYYIDNVEISLLDTLPSCIPYYSFPGNNLAELELLPSPKFYWPVQNLTSGYYFFLGTDNPPTNILNGLDLQGSTYYYPDTLLTVETTYYWKVVPYNPLGQATDCPVYQFSTISKRALPLIETFDDYWLGNGWTQTQSSSWMPSFFYVEPSSNAGGLPNEVSYYMGEGLYSGLTRLISPPLKTAGISSLKISFRCFIQTIDSGATIKLQTSSDGVQWNDENWQLSSAPIQTYGPLLLEIPLLHYGGEYTYVALTVEGKLFRIYHLYLDEVFIEDTLAPPPCAGVVYPMEGDTGVSNHPAFTWNKIPLALNYLLSVGTDSAAENILDHVNIGDTNSYAYCCLPNDTVYYWKIDPVFADDTASCIPVMFQTAKDPLQQLPYAHHLDSLEWPWGWTTDPAFTMHWSVNAGNEAGGRPNEFQAIYELIPMEKTIRLISPPFNTSGETSLNLLFRHFFDGYDTGIIARVQSSADGINWTDESWHITGYDGDYGPEEVYTHITHNLGNRTYIAWSLIGNQYNFDYWYIDDIRVYSTKDHDVGVQQLFISQFINAADTITPAARIRNFGLNAESFSVTMQIPGISYSSTIQVPNLMPDSAADVSFAPQVIPPGMHMFKSFTSLVNDQYHGNDTSYSDQVNSMYASWEMLDTIPAWVELGSGAVYQPDDSSAYLFLSGGDYPFDRLMQRFNFNSKQWDIYDTLPVPLRNHASAVLGDYLYLFGGIHSALFDVSNATVHRFHIPTHTWDSVQPMPLASRLCKAATCGDSLIYLAGGLDTLSQAISEVFLYNINTDSWRQVTPMPSIRFAGGFAVNAGRICYIGGADNSDVRDDVYIGIIDSLDHASITWSQYNIPSGPRFRFDAAVWGDSAIVMAGGGADPDFIPDDPSPSWMLNLLTMNWTQMPDLPLPVVGSSSGSAFMGEAPDGSENWCFAVAGGFDGTYYYHGIQLLNALIPGTAAATASISGSLKYDNVNGTGLNNSAIILKEGGNVVASLQTGSGGSFTFNNLPAGIYTLQASTTKPWGGGNSIDALLIMRHFVGLTYLSGLKLVAGDTDASGNVNAVDALNVTRRFVGLISAFPAGDWKFESPSVTLGQGENKVVHLKGICVGDVDASYVVPLK